MLDVILVSGTWQQLMAMVQMVETHRHGDSSALPQPSLYPGAVRQEEKAPVPYGTGHQDVTERGMDHGTRRTVKHIEDAGEAGAPREVLRLALLLALGALEGFRKYVMDNTPKDRQNATRRVLECVVVLYEVLVHGYVLTKDTLEPTRGPVSATYYSDPLDFVAHVRDLYCELTV